ncbi:uncharacterized protein LOC118753558 isoform X2 [Rhagoletis pomonella]|uniref:uncharacterized protein LOC118753558 isoform X2 n=1 Tax=Rhagoletis pomonella TaxID=28610 RepID=UPI001785C1C1|nr:uncharacterized protein LOC118753558 isoform X2 [Rhagoletis pomonella]
MQIKTYILDGCHIEIHPSTEDAIDYHNYKGWYSTVLLALVDARCRFIYINVGAPGRCNDSQIYEKSTLKQQLQECRLLKDMTKKISNVNIPIVIIGDSAFRFSDSLMKPYPFHLSQTSEQKRFNYVLSKSRRVVENAFGQLKARFRRIGKGIDNQMGNANLIIKASCALHNFLNENNDQVNDKWITAAQELEKRRQCPETAVSFDYNSKAEEIRQALSLHFAARDVDGVGGGDISIGTESVMQPDSAADGIIEDATMSS